MSKRRSSMRGKGAEILFGVPPAVEIQPRTSDPTLTEAESPEPQPALQEALADEQADTEAHAPAPSSGLEDLPDADLEKALLQEAGNGAPLPVEGDLELSLSMTEPQLTPEMEAALFEEAIVAKEPSEPLAQVPIPTLEARMEEQEMLQDAILHEPPPPETSDIAVDVLPPRGDPLPGHLADEEPVAKDIQAPDEEVEWLDLPERTLTEEEKREVLARLGGARIRELDEQIDRMYDQVLEEVGENGQIATECYNLLLKARDILLHLDVAKIPQAEYYIEQVRARLKRADESEAGARRMQWWILGWGLLWCTVFLALVLLFTHEWFRNLVAPESGGSPLVDVPIFLTAAVWGGIGGVVAILYSLFKHVGRRDFDSQFSISYIGKPFLGLILGATVFMVFNLLVRALGIWPAGLQGAPDSLAVAPGAIYLVAWACGFKENRIFDLVDRAMKRMFGGNKGPETTTPAEPTEPVE